MTSSPKLEAHNEQHCHQRKSEPQPQATCTANSVTCGFNRAIGIGESRHFKFCVQIDTDEITSTDMDSIKMHIHQPQRSLRYL